MNDDNHTPELHVATHRAEIDVLLDELVSHIDDENKALVVFTLQECLRHCVNEATNSDEILFAVNRMEEAVLGYFAWVCKYLHGHDEEEMES